MASGEANKPIEQRYSVDPKSRELAEYFLGINIPETTYRALAQQIQDVVEAFCNDLEQEMAKEEPEREPDSFRSLGLRESDFI